MICSKRITLKSVSASKVMLVISFVFAFLLLSGCSQSVDEISIEGDKKQIGNPSSFGNRLFNTDLQGTTSTLPVSASTVLGDHSMGANALRTSSSSPSFRLTSGIGIE